MSVAALDELNYRLLRKLYPQTPTAAEEPPAASKLELFFGKSIRRQISDRHVIDFGCGDGHQAVEMALNGARVTGLDITEWRLDSARKLAEQKGVANRCNFTSEFHGHAEIIISVDAFEHFGDPAAVLRQMRDMLPYDGYVLATFGPPWLHPLGGHLFSVFPWAHLLFSEKALIRWRSDFKTDGATRFHEVEGGLNQMTIRRFESLVAESPFRFEWLHLKPIRVARFFHNRFTRELLTAVVQCKLVPR